MRRRTFIQTLIGVLGLSALAPLLPKKPDWKVAVGKDWGTAQGNMLRINSTGVYQGLHRGEYKTLTCRMNRDGTVTVPPFSLNG